jgi:hypothetical protein
VISMIIGTPTAGDAEKRRNTGGRPFCVDGRPELSKADSSRAPKPRGLSLKNVTRIELLLIQMEANSRALEPSTYDLQLPALFAAHPLTKALAVATIIALWLSTFVAITACVRLSNRNRQTVEQVPAAMPRVVLSVPDTKVTNTVLPRDRLTRALTAPSQKLPRIKDAIHHATTEVLHFSSKGSFTRISRLNSKVKSVEAKNMKTVTDTTAQRPKFWDPLLDRQPMKGAVAHIAKDGNIDYWVLPHGPFFTDPTKVLPIGRSPNGVYVRRLEDGRNYRVTPSGDWYILRVPSDN